VVVDWTEAYEGCLCRCGLGDRRDVIWGCVFVAYRGAKKRDGDRVNRREAFPSYSTPLVRSLARLYKGGGCALLPGCSV
jgi:hypothetical protein